MKTLRETSVRLWLPISILVVWELWANFSPNVFFPAPSRVFLRAMETIDISWLSEYFVPTVYTLLLGYGLGALVGIFVGALLGSSNKGYNYLMPAVVFIRKTPSVVKVPVILALFGISFTSQLLAVVIPVAFILLVVSAKATNEPNRAVFDNSRIFGLNRVQATILLFLPSKLDEILASLRAAIQVALVITILSEMLLGRGGLGVFTITAKDLFDPELMWVGIFVVGTIGFAFHEVFQALENRVRSSIARSSERQ